MKFFAALLLLIPGSVFASSVVWDLNDVSILYPLPAPEARDTYQMIGPADPETGVIHLDISFAGRAAIGYNVTTETLLNSGTASALRVVGVRFDPCFRDHFSDSCKRQIRFSWQPIVRSGDRWVAVDGAAHTFYTLTESDWNELITELDRLRAPYSELTRGEPLQPHPVLMREGLQGPFAVGLRRIFDKYATLKNLTRGASTNPSSGGHEDGGFATTWDFLMGEKNSRGILTRVAVPNILHGVGTEGPGFETVGNEAQTSDSYAPLHNAATDGPYTVSVLKAGIENLLELFMGPLSQGDLLLTYRSVLRIQQPSIHLPGTTDCVSCHASTASRVQLSKQLPEAIRNEIDASVLGGWSDSRFDLSNHSPELANTRVMRAFGYAVADPAISSRVIYESAVVAEAFSKMY